MQSLKGPRPRVIAYASRVLTSPASKYSVTHLEALAVVWTLKHFRDMNFGYPIIVYTGHSAVTQLNFTGRLTRWYLTFMQFESMHYHALFQLCLCHFVLRFVLHNCVLLFYIFCNVLTCVHYFFLCNGHQLCLYPVIWPVTFLFSFNVWTHYGVAERCNSHSILNLCEGYYFISYCH